MHQQLPFCNAFLLALSCREIRARDRQPLQAQRQPSAPAAATPSPPHSARRQQRPPSGQTSRSKSAALQPQQQLRRLQPALTQQQQQQQRRMQQQQQQQRRDAYEDPEVQQRTAAWTQLLANMRSNPEADEFVYMKYAWPDQMPLNPFDLQPCSHADACKQPRHFTISPAGVTAYFSDGSPAEFLPLDAFQRELLLHQQLMRLPLFRHFRYTCCSCGYDSSITSNCCCRIHMQRRVHGACCALWHTINVQHDGAAMCQGLLLMHIQQKVTESNSQSNSWQCVLRRRWKALSIWRKAVRGAKTSSSAEHLQKSMFGLNPVLQQAVLTVR
jgi:hypothetical protein